MARLTIYRDNDTEYTAVSNLFIDEYMEEANDAQLKVYLYLLRMMNAHLATSVSDIADKFNHTEKDVIRALKFWEKRHLLDLDYDVDKNLVGIHMRDLSAGRRPKKVENGASVSFVPMPEAMPQPTVAAVTTYPAPAEYTEQMSAQEPSYEKPVYTADQLRQFKQREETAQLLFVAESYIGKPLTPSEIKSILFFTDVLHFSDDMIDYLIQYCVDKGKKDFKYIEKVAINWAEEGITTPKQAQQKAYQYDKSVYQIMKALGKNASPTEGEVAFIARWTKEYGFDIEIIFEACRRTVSSTDKNRFEYADKILRSWHEQNVHHTSDIQQIDELYKQRKRQSAGSGNKQGGNRFNSFSQNPYDFDALEQELLSN